MWRFTEDLNTAYWSYTCTDTWRFLDGQQSMDASFGIRIYSNNLHRIYSNTELFGAFQKPNNIRIRIRLKFSNRIYSYSYSVPNFKPNIFVFVFGEEKN